MKKALLTGFIALGLFTITMAGNAFAYKIEFSKFGLVDPAKAYTGAATTSPMDAEYNSSTKREARL
ncbi:hypothetical protein MNBD_DELTA01-715 [hydrothermal vent metagenome]|uniref:Uncharacterized protein n=1 Tax=hydrothermal vent metagenome TaxID=652676 RepID=A0A3B0RKS1_9ZZZZ